MEDEEITIFKGDLQGKRVHLVGIKGSGMATLALWLKKQGVDVSGSDQNQRFYTDELLEQSSITSHPFAAENLDSEVDLVIYSQAYNQDHCELERAEQLKLPLLSYPQALGAVSSRFNTVLAVVGVHGKTTTTLMLGTILETLATEATIWAGGGNPLWENAPLWQNGEQLLVVEACEYRKHFLNIAANALLIVSLDWDHQDYFRSYQEVENAFFELLCKLPPSSPVIYNDDDPKIQALIKRAASQNLQFIACGCRESATFQISEKECAKGVSHFQLAVSQEEFRLHSPGLHLLQNAALAVVAAKILHQMSQKDGDGQQNYPETSSCRERNLIFTEKNLWQEIKTGLARFRGATRRSELLAQAAGILFLDDYAHHPTAIAKTLQGIKEFYQPQRLIVDFIAHTYSRTLALWQQFVHCFGTADILFLHAIYASAREEQPSSEESLRFARDISAQRLAASTHYYPEIFEALEPLKSLLKPGDLFLTLGAGNNRSLNQSCIKFFTNPNYSDSFQVKKNYPPR